MGICAAGENALTESELKVCNIHFYVIFCNI